MLKIYTSYNCSSCKKAISWLEQHGIDYEQYNIFAKPLTKDEVLYILKYTENGFLDIISTRSKVYEHYKEELEEKSVSEYINFIIENPSILKRPILIDDVTDNILIGYNEYEMDILL